MSEEDKPTMTDFEFDPYAEFLNFGNRVDREVMGTGEDDDWYSWQVSKLDGNTASVEVYGGAVPTEVWQVTWEKISCIS